MRHWRTTGNSNAAIQTGSTYISDSMTDITTMPTANLGFSTTPRAKKLTPGDCDNDRQPEMAVWPPKPEILMSLERWQTGWQSPRNVGFSAMPSSQKITAGDCNDDHYRKLLCGRFARQYRNFWQLFVVAIIWLILWRARYHRKSRIWRGNLDAIYHSSRDVIISGFGGHIDISGCRSLLYLLDNIILHLYIVLYHSVAGVLPYLS